jgi:uncharacterized PurR-regulated membrane protein YhhQ (DUF165 family)
MCAFSYFLIGMVVLASRDRLHLLAETNCILIVSHVAIGVPVSSLFGTHASVGAIFFAALMFGLAVKYLQYGAEEARSGIVNIVFALLLELGTLMMVQQANGQSPMLAPRIRFAGVCIGSFWLTLSVFVAALNRFRHLHPFAAIPPVTVAMEAFHGLIFYPAAYEGILPWREVTSVAVSGILGSAAVTLISMPVLAWVVWFGRQPPKAAGTH